MMEHLESRAKEELLNMEDCTFSELNDQFLLNFISKEPKIKKNKSSIRNLQPITARQTPQYLDNQNTKELLKSNLKEILETQILSPKSTFHRVSPIATMRTSKHSKTTSKIPTLCYHQRTSRLTDFEKLPLFSLLKQNNSCLVKRSPPIDTTKQSNKKKIFQQQNSQIRKFIKKRIQQKAYEKQQQRILPLTTTIENVKKFKTLINEKIKIQQTIQQVSLIKQRNSNNRSSTKMLKQKIRENAKIIEEKQNFCAVSETLSIKRQKQGSYQSRKLRNILF